MENHWEKKGIESTRPRRDKAAGRKSDSVEARIQAVAFRVSDRILELGCENAELTVALARRTGYVTGAAICDDSLALAQDAGLKSGIHNVSFQRIEGDQLPYEDTIFDAVVTQRILHRFADPEKIVREMIRVLKSPGRLLVADVIGAEDELKRLAHAKILAARYGKAVTLLAPSTFLAICDTAPLEIVAQNQWDERVTFDQWMPAAAFEEAARENIMRMLVAAGKKKTTDLKIEVSGKSLTFVRRWMMVTAEKTGNS